MSFVAYIKNSSGHAEESRESGVRSLEVWVKTFCQLAFPTPDS